MICRARQSLLSDFLGTKADWIYYWDDDVEALNVGGTAGNLIDMLLFHGKRFVGGRYSTKGMPPYHCAGRDIFPFDPQRRLVAVEYLAGGSMLVHRSAVEDLMKAYPDAEYSPRANEAGKGRYFALFTPYIHKGEYLSEDYAFCRRWLDIGCQIWADLDVRLAHWGDFPFGLPDPRQNQGAHPNYMHNAVRKDA